MKGRLTLLIALWLTPALAQAQTAWLRDRLGFEWVVGAGGWRAAVGQDLRAPGFDALAGGGELVLGLDVGAGLAVVADGRVLAGRADGQALYLEGLGGVALQLRLGRARLRAGPAAGQLWLGPARSTLIGGFLGASIDLFPLGAGRLSTALTARLDVDVDTGRAPVVPDTSVGFSLGLGVRY